MARRIYISPQSVLDLPLSLNRLTLQDNAIEPSSQPNPTGQRRKRGRPRLIRSMDDQTPKNTPSVRGRGHGRGRPRGRPPRPTPQSEAETEIKDKEKDKDESALINNQMHCELIANDSHSKEMIQTNAVISAHVMF